MNLNSIPTCTYRLQFNREFTFRQAKEIIPYLSRLGVSHCYASPLLAAKPGSLHGYDIIDYSKINPEIGTLEEFESLIATLHEHHMGLLLDTVPNHMYIASPNNHWWNDILENGQACPFAHYFDIDWHPPRLMHDNKVLLPILDQQYGSVLENQTMKIFYREGAFYLELYELNLPTDPKSWCYIFGPFSEEISKVLPDEKESYQELKSIMTALNHLPSTIENDQEKVAERLREKEVIKKRLETLFNANPKTITLLQQQLNSFNGKKGNPESFDFLDAFLNAQPYRLCFWRVANDEINYRRFFDIFEYAGICTEKKDVFDAVHALTCSFVHKGWVQGLRIDHIDGLWDPEKYLLDIQKFCPPQAVEKNSEENSLFVVVEKILTGDEELRPEWMTCGSVGYDFLNQCNGVYVYQQNKKDLLETYQTFTGIADKPRELAYICKRLVLEVLLSSELQILTRMLEHIAESHRSSQDFTVESLKAAIRDVIACFPVYRSYIQAHRDIIHEEDRQSILTAVAWAKRRNPITNRAVFNFIQDVLLLEYPEGLSEDQKIKRKDFVMRFQQSTGPVMAKGMEDTAFYRYYPLSSLNEVGSDLYTFGISPETFHKKNLEKYQQWPHALLASTTHDTKRGEDVRARINVLSEIPKEWKSAIERWRQINEPHKIQEGDEAIPDANEEYLLYQTMIGTWPLKSMDQENHRGYVERIQKYMEKATKEAKIHTSWINPNNQHDQAIHQFIEKILNLDAQNAFLHDFKTFIPKISSWGMLNSLSQTLLKLTSPGIPDIYQGNEIWDLTLVDPDNRRPVNYPLREELLNAIEYGALHEYIENPTDGRLKLFITMKTLLQRQKWPKLFSEGEYIPLIVDGERQSHVIAFARVHEEKAVLIVVGRFFSFFMQDVQKVQSHFWHGTRLVIPEKLSHYRFKNVFNDKEIDSNLTLEEIMQPLPIALLESI